MQNQFDSANYLSREPTSLAVGDRWAWKRPDLADVYDPASYTLKYSLRLESSTSSEIEITSTASDFVVEVSSSTTAAHTAGRYAWQAYITRNSDSERILVDSGVINVVENRDASTADPRTHARKMLDLIEAALEGIATNEQLDVLSVAFDDRTIGRNPSKLLALRDKYKAEAAREAQAEQLAKSGGHSGRVLVRYAS